MYQCFKTKNDEMDIYNYEVEGKSEYAPNVEIGYSFDISGYVLQGDIRKHFSVWYIDKQKAYEGLKALGETEDWEIESPQDIDGYLDDYLAEDIKDAFLDGLKSDYYNDIELIQRRIDKDYKETEEVAMKGISW